MATKSFYVGPQDGWLNVIVAGTAAAVRISGVPHSHPFYVYGGSGAPTAADNGVLVCHKPFQVENGITGNTDAFYIRVQNPAAGSKNADGRIRIDVYTDGGTLA